ncbi:MAG TPA: AMP-binding protein [Methylomirabilota bacterium]|nr:AMP-binding protein [Methylomirabilota bacterium]
MNLTELLDRAASSWPEKPALIEGENVVSYAALAEQAAAFASQLENLRLPHGCRIGLFYPNSVNYVALTYALWKINAIVVPIPMEFTEEEVSSLVTTIGLEGILSQTPRDKSIPLVADCFFTRLRPASPPDNHGLNIAFIRFTSGTTNARKGVVLCHETIRDRVLAANQGFGIGPDDTVVWCLPMAHHFLITIVLYLNVGATIVLARHVLAKPFLEAVNRWKGTVLYAAPFHFSMLARDKSEANIASVRLAVSTTCALPQDVADDFARRFGLPLMQAFGVIELGLVCLNNDDPQGRWNSVGRPRGSHRVRIADPDENGCGEVAISGPGFFDAYAAPWMSRDEVLRDGWFYTGDIGRLDEDGFLFLLSRKTAVINLAGRKVFPEEIETVLNRHPAVKESRVYGRRHPHLGEVVEAELVLAQPETGLDSVRQYCREQLASYKVPMQFNLVTALPRTPVTGKIVRTDSPVVKA